MTFRLMSLCYDKGSFCFESRKLNIYLLALSDILEIEK